MMMAEVQPGEVRQGGHVVEARVARGRRGDLELDEARELRERLEAGVVQVLAAIQDERREPPRRGERLERLTREVPGREPEPRERLEARRLREEPGAARLVVTLVASLREGQARELPLPHRPERLLGRDARPLLDPHGPVLWNLDGGPTRLPDPAHLAVGRLAPDVEAGLGVDRPRRLDEAVEGVERDGLPHPPPGGQDPADRLLVVGVGLEPPFEPAQGVVHGSPAGS
jgi:hypothetical protein